MNYVPSSHDRHSLASVMHLPKAAQQSSARHFLDSSHPAESVHRTQGGSPLKKRLRPSGMLHPCPYDTHSVSSTLPGYTKNSKNVKKRWPRRAPGTKTLPDDHYRRLACPSCLHPSHSSFPSSFLFRHLAHLHHSCRPLALDLPPSCLSLPPPPSDDGPEPKTPRFSMPSLWY